MTTPINGLEIGLVVQEMPHNIYDVNEIAIPRVNDSQNNKSGYGAKLKIDKISKTYQIRGGELVKVIENIEMEIEEGEFVSLVGPSGCGKSTLLNIIAGLEKPDSGKVWSNIRAKDHNRLLIFQETALFPWLTVSENVAYGLRLRKYSKKQCNQLVTKYLELVNLLTFKESYIHQLSGGMKQRVALARALVLEPEILLMDEPFAALDIKTRKDMYQLLLNIWQATGKTILFITHNVDEALILSNRILVMNSHPGVIKSEYKLNAKYPRTLEDESLQEIKKSILKEFVDDFDIDVDQGGKVNEEGN